MNINIPNKAIAIVLIVLVLGGGGFALYHYKIQPDAQKTNIDYYVKGANDFVTLMQTGINQNGGFAFNTQDNQTIICTTPR